MSVRVIRGLLTGIEKYKFSIWDIKMDDEYQPK